MKHQIASILKTFFDEEDTYGRDYALATMLNDLANLAGIDIEELAGFQRPG